MINYTENEERSREHSRKRNNNTSSAVTVGIILVLIGCVFILSNIGLLSWEWKHFLISWQMLLIVIGVICLSNRNVAAGVILVLIGGFFITPKLTMVLPGIGINHNFIDNFWPILICFGGLALILSSRNRRDRRYHHSNYNHSAGYTSPEPGTGNSSSAGMYGSSKNNEGYIDFSYIFSGGDEIIMDPIFKGGSIRAIFGGATIDLRRTSLPEDQPTYLKIDAVFGGVSILVPEQWDVELRKSAFLGGFDDERRFRPTYPTGNQKLIIDVSCVFGGGEIK